MRYAGRAIELGIGVVLVVAGFRERELIAIGLVISGWALALDAIANTP